VLDFRQGIRLLIQAGELNANSEFCRKTLEGLDQYVQIATTSSIPLDEFRAAPPLLTAVPTTDTEKLIFNALRISLRLKIEFQN